MRVLLTAVCNVITEIVDLDEEWGLTEKDWAMMTESQREELLDDWAEFQSHDITVKWEKVSP